MDGSVDGRTIGWGRFVSGGVLFALVGDGPVPFFATVLSFAATSASALAKFEYEPTHLFASVGTVVLL